jgi:glycerol-3-phosphate cytidylyltransferase
LLEAIRYVDLVIPEQSWEQKEEDIEKYDVDVFVIGDDWEGKFDFLKSKCEVIYLSRTDEISTTKIKTDLQELSPPTHINVIYDRFNTNNYFLLLMRCA